jgi:Tol biopolymer transport system component
VPGATSAPQRAGGYEIYGLDLASGRTHDLSANPGADWDPAPSPDGRWIAFGRTGPHGGYASLWLMRSDGTRQRRLAFVLPKHTTWSPDGRRIAFVSEKGDLTSPLWVVGRNGVGLRKLTAFDVASPAWSPDGRRIAFSAEDDFGFRRIGTIAPDGRGLRWLTKGAGWDTEPAWSPDAKRVVFLRSPCGNECADEDNNLFVVGANGSGERQLTAYAQGSSRPVSAPAWSPNGRLIVFLRRNPTTFPYDLNRIAPDGRGLRLVATHVSTPASWSPSGRRLAFGQGGGGAEFNRLTVEPVGGARRYYRLPLHDDLESGPFWSRQGRGLVYSMYR